MNTHRRTGHRHRRQARPCWLALSRSMMMHRKGNEHSQAYSLTGSYHCRQRRTGTQGHRQGRHPRSCCSLLLALALSLYDDEHRKGNERSQGHRNTDRLTPLQALAIADTGGQGHRRATPSLSLGLILTGEYRHRRTGHRRDTAPPLATTDTGDRLAPVGSRPLGL